MVRDIQGFDAVDLGQVVRADLPAEVAEAAFSAASGETSVRGSSFDDFLKEDGTYAEVTAQSIKRALACQLQQAMAKQAGSSRLEPHLETV